MPQQKLAAILEIGRWTFTFQQLKVAKNFPTPKYIEWLSRKAVEE